MKAKKNTLQTLLEISVFRPENGKMKIFFGLDEEFSIKYVTIQYMYIYKISNKCLFYGEDNKRGSEKKFCQIKDYIMSLQRFLATC